MIRAYFPPFDGFDEVENFKITPEIEESIKRVIDARNKKLQETKPKFFATSITDNNPMRPKTDNEGFGEIKDDGSHKKYSHYFKDVSNLKTIDVYRVLDLFNVTDPCLQHAVKKLLVAGGRGVKNKSKDVQEAIDTLFRWQAMNEENLNR